MKTLIMTILLTVLYTGTSSAKSINELNIRYKKEQVCNGYNDINANISFKLKNGSIMLGSATLFENGDIDYDGFNIGKINIDCENIDRHYESIRGKIYIVKDEKIKLNKNYKMSLKREVLKRTCSDDLDARTENKITLYIDGQEVFQNEKSYLYEGDCLVKPIYEAAHRLRSFAASLLVGPAILYYFWN